jgi:hypothetical protein
VKGNKSGRQRARRVAMASARKRGWLGIATLAVFWLSTPLAHADDALIAKRAEGLAQEGRRALKHKDFEVAEERFRRADALVHNPVWVIGQARALAGLGRLLAAHARYEQVLGEDIPRDAPKSLQRAVQDAQNEIAAIKTRFAWLTISVTGPLDPIVSVDGHEIPAALVGVRTAADPGRRTIVVRAQGYRSQEQAVTLTEGEESTVEVELEPFGDSLVEGADAAKVEPGVAQPAPVTSAKTSDPNRKVFLYCAFGVGGAGLIAGAVTGLAFLFERSSLLEACPNNRCAARYADRVARYHIYGTVAPVAFGVGLAGAGVAAWLLLSNSSNGPRMDRARARVLPYAGRDQVGIVGSF